jgi:hypothetical protein
VSLQKGLIKRGDRFLWRDEEVLETWCEQKNTGTKRRTKTYSEVAIILILTLKYLYHLPLCATQGFIQWRFKR